MQDLKSLLDLMFETGEEICPSNSKFACHSTSISLVLSGEVTLISVNPKVPPQKVKTEDLTLLAINPIKGYRRDSNVTAFRTFLFEQDTGTLKAQMDMIKSLGLPYSALIFSGNKSIHTLVTLATDLEEKEYRFLYQWALKINALFDQNCKNPSRMVRIPGAVRLDTGGKQRLLELKDRVEIEDFKAWLKKYPECEPKLVQEKKDLTYEGGYEKIPEWIKKQFIEGIDFTGGRNSAWFKLACSLAKVGYSRDEVEEILGQYFSEDHDFRHKEWLKTISSAFDTVYREKG